MKALNTIVKLLAALAAVLGGIYILATYGEKIVAWAKSVVIDLPDCPCGKDAKPVAETVEEPAAEEAAAEEAAPAEAPAEESAPEVVVTEHEPVAEEADFAE